MQVTRQDQSIFFQAMSANVQPLLQQVGSPSGQSDSSTRISTPAELKLERSGVRSPLSLAHHQQQQQHQQQPQPQHQPQQQQQHHQQLMDYGLGRMSTNSMLGMTTAGTGSHLLNNNLGAIENGGAPRMASPSNNSSNNNNEQQLLSPNGHQAVAGAVQSQGLSSFSRNLSTVSDP